MYAVDIELGYNIPHNFDYVARQFFLTSFVMGITHQQMCPKILSERVESKWTNSICPTRKKQSLRQLGTTY